jgi:uncharacterized protein (UPF0332 family)
MMVVQGKEFYELSGKIHQGNLGDEEICFRCSINRAYYGAFHVAKKYVGLEDKKDTTHAYVINQLRRRMRYLGDSLGSLYDYRWKADYNLSIDITKSDAEKIIKKAYIIINTIESKNK